MAEYTVKLPDVGEGIAEAEIVEWHIAVGDTIREDDVMVEVMTDKATVELPAPVTGMVTWFAGAAGDVVSVGSDLVRIEVGGGAGARMAADALITVADAGVSPEPIGPDMAAEGLVAVAAQHEIDSAPVRTGDAQQVSAAVWVPAPAPDRSVDGPVRASPAVRERAHRLRIDLGGIAGSGPDGRVLHADLDALLTDATGAAADPGAAPGGAPNRAAGSERVERTKVIGLRRNIAERMQLSKRRIPHFTYVEEVDVTELEVLRTELNSRPPTGAAKLTLLPLLIRAMIRAVSEFPQMNARFDDDAGVIERYGTVHLGIATQTPRGLMVPVIHDAQLLDIWQCAAEVARLSEAARTSKIKIDELVGSTITITSLGALGGIVSTPVINYPEVAIVGVNKIVERPTYRDGLLMPRKIMNLSSSFDHRMIDGVDAAGFIQEIRRRLETPALLFMN